MSIFKEFRDFLARGNVVDLAVGVIIGGAFGKIVTSLVSDVVMPPIGLLLGGVDFSAFKLILKPAASKTAEVAVTYGVFVNTVIQFLIIAAVIFLVVKAINTLHRKIAAEAEAKAETEVLAEVVPTPSERLLTEIRDLLAAKASHSNP